MFSAIVFLLLTQMSSRTFGQYLVCCEHVYTKDSIYMWAGQLSRYSDWLRAGRSGDRILVGARFSAPVRIDPRVHPASYTMGTGSFPGIKRPGHGVNHPPPPAPRLKKEQGYNSAPPLGLRDLFQGELQVLTAGKLCTYYSWATNQLSHVMKFLNRGKNNLSPEIWQILSRNYMFRTQMCVRTAMLASI